MTCRPEYGEDAAAVFNLLTGFCQFEGTTKLMVAPFEFQSRTLELIKRETDYARAGKPARIIAKMNSLVDKPVIEALYEASQAGVKIDLVVRGICCLRPGVPEFSPTITVRSIVDRFLEHSRIYYFANDDTPEIYVGSGDWMYRNFKKRIEVAFPIEEPALQSRILDEILPTHLGDNVKAHQLRPDGTYEQLTSVGTDATVRSQLKFMELSRQAVERPQQDSLEFTVASAPPENQNQSAA
jgi:polyphosphate kinase